MESAPCPGANVAAPRTRWSQGRLCHYGISGCLASGDQRSCLSSADHLKQIAEQPDCMLTLGVEQLPRLAELSLIVTTRSQQFQADAQDVQRLSQIVCEGTDLVVGRAAIGVWHRSTFRLAGGRSPGAARARSSSGGSGSVIVDLTLESAAEWLAGINSWLRSRRNPRAAPPRGGAAAPRPRPAW